MECNEMTQNTKGMEQRNFFEEQDTIVKTWQYSSIQQSTHNFFNAHALTRHSDLVRGHVTFLTLLKQQTTTVTASVSAEANSKRE